MKMLQKLIDCKYLEIYQENFYDGVSFSKVTSLRLSECNFTIKRTHNSIFLPYVPKTSYLKIRKKYMANQCLKQVPAL